MFGEPMQVFKSLIFNLQSYFLFLHFKYTTDNSQYNTHHVLKSYFSFVITFWVSAFITCVTCCAIKSTVSWLMVTFFISLLLSSFLLALINFFVFYWNHHNHLKSPSHVFLINHVLNTVVGFYYFWYPSEVYELQA